MATRDDSDDDKPDPQKFIRMRQVREGDTNRVNEYLPSANPDGIVPRKRVNNRKKWKPKPTTENKRPDDWVGGGGPKKRSWTVKKVSSKPPESSSDEEDSEDDEDGNKNGKVTQVQTDKPAAVAKEPAKEVKQKIKEMQEVKEVEEVKEAKEAKQPDQLSPAAVEEEETETEPTQNDESEANSDAVAPAATTANEPSASDSHDGDHTNNSDSKPANDDDDDDDKPDPKKFIRMRHVREGDTNRVDEYLPSANPDGIVPRKRVNNRKKWTPKPTSENKRPDDWVGSAGPKKRSWKVKSKPVAKPADDEDSSENSEHHDKPTENGHSKTVTTKSTADAHLLSPQSVSKAPDVRSTPTKKFTSPRGKLNIPSVFGGTSKPFQSAVSPNQKPRCASTRASWKPKSPTKARKNTVTLAMPPQIEDEDAGHVSDGALQYARKSRTTAVSAASDDEDIKKAVRDKDDSTHDDDDKPDPKKFIRMRHVREGDTNRVDEYLPSANPNGIVPRKRVSHRKKWTPKPTSENKRPDDWVGGGGPKKRSWTVKKVSSKPPESSSDEEDNEDEDINNSNSNGNNNEKVATEVEQPQVEDEDEEEVQELKDESATTSTVDAATKRQSMDMNWKPLGADDAGPTADVEVRAGSDHDKSSKIEIVRIERDSDDESSAVEVDSDSEFDAPVVPDEQSTDDENWSEEYEEEMLPDGTASSDGDKVAEPSGNANEPTEKPPPVVVATEIKISPKPVVTQAEPQKEESAIPDTEQSKSSVTTDSKPANDDGDDDKPDPKKFIRMRHVREGDTNRVDEYLPSANPDGIVPRKRVSHRKKWTPKPSSINKRPDDWVGGAGPKKRSWTVKKVIAAPVDDSDSESDSDDN